MIEDYRYGRGLIEHLHRYAFVMPFVKGKVVVDIASGEGYGSNLIAQQAAQVTGVDVSAEAVQQAATKYKRPNLSFVTGSATSIPLNDQSVDVVVSFETLEHLLEQDQMIAEIRRVLKPAGMLIISTPEKENYHPTDPDNPYHLKELTSEEFMSLLGKYFKVVKNFRQRYLSMSMIYADRADSAEVIEMSGNFERINPEENFFGKHLFNIAVASATELPVTDALRVFNGNAIMEAQTQYYENKIEEIFASRTFLLGKYLLWPFWYVKTKLSK